MVDENTIGCDMVAKRSEPSPVNSRRQEHPMMAPSQENKQLINHKCQRTDCFGMTCQNKNPRDEYVKGTYQQCNQEGFTALTMDTQAKVPESRE